MRLCMYISTKEVQQSQLITLFSLKSIILGLTYAYAPTDTYCIKPFWDVMWLIESFLILSYKRVTITLFTEHIRAGSTIKICSHFSLGSLTKHWHGRQKFFEKCNDEDSSKNFFDHNFHFITFLGYKETRALYQMISSTIITNTAKGT